MKVYHHKKREHAIPTWKKWNPIWWLLNEDRPFDERFTFFGIVIDDSFADWKRSLLFAIRNPGHNFTHYVIGVSDKAFSRFGNDPAHVWSEDFPQRRHNWCVIRFAGRIPRPFLSYKGRVFEWYLGWRQAGNFGLALRRAQKG